MPHPQKLTAGWVESWEKLLAGNLPFKIFLKGRDLTYLACNENYAVNHGMKPSEILGRSDFDLYPKELAEKYRAEDLRILETGRSETIEGRYVKDGQEHHGQTIKSLFRDQSGEVIGILGTFWDITELKQTEEKLRESEDRYRAIYDQSPIAIELYDTAGTLVHANPACLNLFGIEDIQAIRSFSLFADPNINDEQKEKLRQGETVQYQGPFDFEKVKTLGLYPTSREGIAWLDVLITPLGNRAHAITGFLAQVQDITDRKQAEDAFADAHWRLESIIEGTNVGTWEWNVQTGETVYNELWAQIIGYTLDELVPISIKTWETFSHPEDLKQSDELLERHLSGELPYYDCECRMKHKDGHWVWVRDRGRIITRTGDGKPLMMFGTHTDITAQKQAEESLRRKQTMLARTEGIANIGSWEWDIATDTVTWSDELFRIFQRDPQEGAPSFAEHPAFYHPDDMARLQQAVEVAVALGTPYELELRANRKDGETRVCLARGVAEMTPGGRAVRLFGSLQDITDRKRAEEALQESEQKYRLLADNASDVIMLMDMNLKAIFFSPSVTSVLGYSVEEALKGSMEDRMTPASIEKAAKQFQVGLDKEKSHPGDASGQTLELEMIHKNGSIVMIEMAVSFLRDQGGKPTSILGILRDITDRKRAEHQIRERMKELQAFFSLSELTERGGLTLDELYQELTNILQKSWQYPEIAYARIVIGDREFCTDNYTQSPWRQSEPIKVNGSVVGETEVGYLQQKPEEDEGSFLKEERLLLNAIAERLGSIIARKRVEEALRESEEQYRSLFETMAQGVVYQDADGQITNANPAAEKILGLSLDQMQGRTSVDPRWRAIHEDGSDFPGETHPAIVALRTGREVHDVVMGVFHSAKEAYSWIMINAVPQFHPDEERPYRVYTTFDDITERKNAEDALRESEERYRSLFEHMLDGYAYCKMIYDDQGHPVDFVYLDVNSAFKRLAGLENMVGKPASEAIPGIRESTPELFQSYGRVASTGKPEKFEIDFKPLSKWFSISVYSPAREYFVAVFDDITERKRAEKALRESEEKYRRIVDTSNEGILVSDETHRTTFANRRMAELLSYTPEELLGQSMEEFIFPEDLADQRQRMSNRRQGVGEQYERRLRRRDGSILWTSVSSTPILENGEFRGSIGLFTDISERKRMEERIHQVRNDLLFAVSHDLKSPLQTLRQTQEILSQLPPVEALARFQEYGEIWRRNLQRLERMINNLVDSQRGEEDCFPLLRAPCDPGEMVQRVVEDLTGYALALQIQFDLKLKAVPEGSCDEETLARVVENLLTNAVKFSPQGGRVEVRLGMEGDTLLLEVEDHGAGIPALEQGQLFQPFQRSRSAQQKGIPGTGLGLYVCRRIVEEHGGTITLTSEEGKGTTVTVRLPWSNS